MVLEGEMRPASYTLLHPEPRLSTTDQRALVATVDAAENDCSHEQEPPSTTLRGFASPAHLILHVESPAQDSEQFALQRRVHVDPPSQLMLPLGPTVTSHSEPPLQLTLHDAPQVPPQALRSVQVNVQLDPLQPESPMSHAACAGQVHEVPVHSGGGGVSPPHATTATTSHRGRRSVCRKRTIDILRVNSKNSTARNPAPLLEAEAIVRDRAVLHAYSWDSPDVGSGPHAVPRPS